MSEKIYASQEWVKEKTIPNVSSATVGQTIVVKTVGTDGKPTEWEATTLPSGSSISLDTTLTQDGFAADAKSVGDAISRLSEEMLKEETDPTVPTWAKAETKPTYTAAEVGALPADTVIPSIDGLASETYVDNAVAGVNAVPSATIDDNDKILMVVNGIPTWKEADPLSITSSDDGAGNVTITIA